jgi:hypothetical protein
MGYDIIITGNPHGPTIFCNFSQIKPTPIFLPIQILEDYYTKPLLIHTKASINGVPNNEFLNHNSSYNELICAIDN